MNKFLLSWILAIFITLSAVIYQRSTGPTYPKKVNVTIDNQDYKLKLKRSSSLDKPCTIEMDINDPEINGYIFYHRFPTDEPYDSVKLKYNVDNEVLTCILPDQPAAGKLQYYVALKKAGKITEIRKDEPIIIRFKGAVPGFVLIPHVLFMFAAMLLLNLAGLLAIFKHKKFRLYTKLSFLLLLIGGMILGPVVQNYAFGELWTGVPFGWDLTDNKTLIAFIALLIAVIGNWKKERPYLTIIASCVFLLIYSIPHSMFGSELNYTTGNVSQG